MASLEVETRPAPPTVLDANYDKRLMIAAGRSSEELGGKIADRLGVALTNPGLKTFSNGEIYCRFEESIRGADIFLVQSTAGNPEEGLTANDALVELLIMIDAAVAPPRTGSSPSPRGTATRARTRSPRRASRSARASWPGCSRRRASIGS